MNWYGRGCWWRRQFSLRTLYLLLLGQLVSFVLAVVSFSTSLIAKLGVDVPITQSCFTYFTLAVVYGSILLYRRQRVLVPWYWYLVLGFADVQANYFYNKAFQFSSITSVTLLDCWTIAWVMILSWLFLSTHYSLFQFFGASLCVLGLGLVLFSDAGVGGGGGSRPLLGDALVIAATLFFALSNTGEEFCIKKKDSIEVVSMMGLNGLLVSMVEISIVEVKSLQSVKWSANVILAFAGFTLSSFTFYSLAPSVLKLSGATMFNLSLLTSDMWAVIIRIFLYHQQVDWLYYLAFILVAIGLIIYSTSEEDSVPIPGRNARTSNPQYQVLDTQNIAADNEALTS